MIRQNKIFHFNYEDFESNKNWVKSNDLISINENGGPAIIYNSLDQVSYGVRWKTNQTSPELERVGNANLHTSLPIQNKMKAVLVNGVDENGEPIIVGELDPNDWTKFKDDPILKADSVDFNRGYVYVSYDNLPQIYEGCYAIFNNGRLPLDNISESEFGSLNWSSTEKDTSLPDKVFRIIPNLNAMDIMIEVPKFYIKSFEYDGYKEVRISEINVDGTWEKQNRILIDANHLSNANTPIKSKESIDSLSNLGKTNIPLSGDKVLCNYYTATIEYLCRKLGKSMINYNQYKNIFVWLPVIEFATFNIQKALTDQYLYSIKHGGLGTGVTTMSSEDYQSYGYGAVATYANIGVENLNNGIGYKEFTSGSSTIQLNWYRGIIAPFGDIGHVLNGVVIINEPAENGKYPVYTTTDKNKYLYNTENEDFSENEFVNPYFIISDGEVIYIEDDNLKDFIIKNYELVGYLTPNTGEVKELDLGSSANIIPSETSEVQDYSKYKCSKVCSYDSGISIVSVGGYANHNVKANVLSFASDMRLWESASFVGFRAIYEYKD